MILSRKATGNNKRFNTSKHRDGTIGSSYLHGLLMVLMIRSAHCPSWAPDNCDRSHPRHNHCRARFPAERALCYSVDRGC